MDERTLEVVIKASNETGRAFAEVQGQVAGLTTSMLGATGLQAAANAVATGFAGMSTQWQITAGVIGAAVTAFAPFTAAIVANIANIAAMSAMAFVGVGAIGALAGAIFLLGAANAGGLNPAAEMIKTQKALEAAVKEHLAALKELDQVKAGQGAALYGTGLSQAQMLNIAQTYVGVTGANVSDAQRNLAEPMSGLNGPIAKLGTALDDMRDHFERVSRPMADAIAAWLLPLVSGVQTAGDALAKWFGDRLPSIFQFMSALIKDMGGVFGVLFSAIGKVIDYVLANQKDFIGFFDAIGKVAVGAFVWLLQAAVNIHEWFKANWPGILKWIGDFLDGFKLWGPIIGPELKAIGDNLGGIAKNIGVLQPMWIVMGAGIGAMVTVALSGLTLLLETINLIIQGLTWIANNGKSTIPSTVPYSDGYWVGSGRSSRFVPYPPFSQPMGGGRRVG